MILSVVPGLGASASSGNFRNTSCREPLQTYWRRHSGILRCIQGAEPLLPNPVKPPWSSKCFFLSLKHIKHCYLTSVLPPYFKMLSLFFWLILTLPICQGPESPNSFPKRPHYHSSYRLISLGPLPTAMPGLVPLPQDLTVRYPVFNVREKIINSLRHESYFCSLSQPSSKHTNGILKELLVNVFMDEFTEILINL